MKTLRKEISHMRPDRISRKNHGRHIGAASIVLAVLLITLTLALAVQMLVNGTFQTALTSWTTTNVVSGLTTSWDSAGYANGGCVRFRTSVGSGLAGNAYISQTTGSIAAGNTVRLTFRWKKLWVGVAAQTQTLYVDIRKPSTTVVRIWSHTTVSNANTWTLADQDVSSYFNETGAYQIRFGADLKNGTNSSAQTTGWFDEVSLDSTVPVDTTPPTVSITAPTNGAFIRGTYTITANATDNVAVASVEFYYNTTNLIGTDTTAPYSIAWNTTGVANGAYALTAKAFDTSSNSATSTAVNVTVDNTNPTSTITSPVASQLIPETNYAVVGTASDTNFSQYTLHYGAGASPSVWNDIGTNPRTTPVVAGTLGTWNTVPLSDGVYTIRLITTDAATNSTTTTVTVNVDSTLPTVVSATGATPTLVDVLLSESLSAPTIQSSYFTINNSIVVSGATLQADNRTVRLNTTTQTGGLLYTVTVKNTAPTVQDLAGNFVGVPNTAQFTGALPDFTPPSVSITNPANGAFIGGTYNITANATDNVGVSSVEFYYNSTNLIGADNTAPYSVSWNTTGVSEGSYTLTAKAFDTSNNSATSPAVSVTVDNTNPTSIITNPVSSQLVPGTNYAIVGTAYDANFSQYTLHYGAGVSPSVWNDIGANPRTLLVVGGTLGTWNTTSLSDGSYTLRLITTDKAGNSITYTVLVTVDRTLPTVVSATAVSYSFVDVLFSENLDASTVLPSYFTINNGLSVTGAALQADYKTVRVGTSTQTTATIYTVTVKNTAPTVKDAAGNIVGTPNTAQFSGFAGPTSVITTPTDDQIVKATVTITGTASGANFTQYTLKAAKGKMPASNFKDIGTNPRLTPVTNGTLGTWNTSTFADGDYVIQLTTKNSLSQQTIATVRVVLDDTPPVVNSARAVNSTTVDLLFREHIGATLDPAYFTITGLTISAAQRLEDNRTVRLTTSAQTSGAPYTVTVRSTSPTVADKGGTEIAGVNNTANFTGYNSLTIRGDGNLLRRHGDDPTCGGMMMGCHDYQNHSSDTTSSKYGTWGRMFNCQTCHTPHGSRNIYLIKETIATPNSGNKTVDFRTTGIGDPYNSPDPAPGTHDYSLGDATDNFNDSVCEVCHTQTTYFRNSDALTPDKTHNNDGNCIACHQHKIGFTPLSCSDCHNAAQDNGDGIPAGGRREVVSEFVRSSHHLQGASVNDNDCGACHEMTQHQQGYVRVKNADDATVTQLAADPSTNSVEAAKLTVPCLACHDANGAGGLLPFTDGLTPPVIDNAGWTASSHKAVGALSCFGDGGTFGCHSNGHGSQKLKLLAPSTVAPTPPNNPEQEEGFCYVCHDANGPATKDLQTAFSNPKVKRHPVLDSEQPVGRPVECIDCHNMHLAQAGIHNVSATATSTRNLVSPVLIGTSGVQFNYAGLANFATPTAANFTAVGSATYEYQICFKCHTSYKWGVGSPPAGLSANGTVANPLETDVAIEFNPNNRSGHPVVTGLDNYPNSTVVGGKKGLLAAAMKAPWNTNIGTQTMMCSDCHNTDSASPAAQGPHGSALQFMLRGPNSANWPNVTLSSIATSWCINCHNNSAGQPHTQGGHSSYQCYRCHIVIPHGGKLSRLIADNDTMPSRYAYSNTLSTQNLQAFTKAATTGYTTANCKAQCYADHQNTTPGENW